MSLEQDKLFRGSVQSVFSWSSNPSCPTWFNQVAIHLGCFPVQKKACGQEIRPERVTAVLGQEPEGKMWKCVLGLCQEQECVVAQAFGFSEFKGLKIFLLGQEYQMSRQTKERGIRELQVTLIPNSRSLQSKVKPVPKVLRRQETLKGKWQSWSSGLAWRQGVFTLSNNRIQWAGFKSH